MYESMGADLIQTTTHPHSPTKFFLAMRMVLLFQTRAQCLSLESSILFSPKIASDCSLITLLKVTFSE